METSNVLYPHLLIWSLKIKLQLRGNKKYAQDFGWEASKEDRTWQTKVLKWILEK